MISDRSAALRGDAFRGRGSKAFAKKLCDESGSDRSNPIFPRTFNPQGDAPLHFAPLYSGRKFTLFKKKSNLLLG